LTFDLELLQLTQLFLVVGAISAPNFVKIRRIVNNLGKIRIQMPHPEYDPYRSRN